LSLSAGYAVARRRRPVNRSRIIVLIAVLVLAVALLASTALAGAKDSGKKWGAGAALSLIQQ
jgi:hypothetical protein